MIYYTFRRILSVGLLGLILLGCQEEYDIDIDEERDKELASTSIGLMDLLKRVVMHDGSFDDAIDNGSCYSIQFPYTVQWNTVSYLVTSKKAVETLTRELNAAEAELKIQFPITVSKLDYTEQLVVSQTELEALSTECAKNRDNTINCLDMVYPILIASFDARKEQLQTLTINHDKDLYQMISKAFGSEKMQIKYPLALRSADTLMTLVVTSDTELMTAIQSLSGDCN